MNEAVNEKDIEETFKRKKGKKTFFSEWLQ